MGDSLRVRSFHFETLDAGFELHPQEPAELKGIAEPVRTWAVMAQRG